MDRLPPKRFLVVYWALTLGALVPGLLLNAESPTPWLRAMFMWFNACGFFATAWQAFWFWRALQFADSHPALPPGQPDRVRKVRRLALPLAPVYLAAFVLCFFPTGWLASHTQGTVAAPILAMVGVATGATTIFIVAIISRAIRDAEIAAASSISRSAFSTFLQLVYLPFAAPFLRHRLEVIAGEPSDLIAQPA